MVARELGSNRLIRLWRDELGSRPPFPVDDDALFVAYFASAELGCFLELGCAAAGAGPRPVCRVSERH
jgi:hypothetical protein